MTVARLDGQIRYQHIETSVLVLLCSDYAMKYVDLLRIFKRILASECAVHTIIRVNGRISCAVVVL